MDVLPLSENRGILLGVFKKESKELEATTLPVSERFSDLLPAVREFAVGGDSDFVGLWHGGNVPVVKL